METSILLMPLFMSFLLLFTLAQSDSLNTTRLPKCHENERSALLEFKATFYNKTPCNYDLLWVDLRTWKVEGENRYCCEWDGIDCDEQGHVVRLFLCNSCLSGSINSSSSIFKLVYLQELNLGSNDFQYSKIPSAVGNLSRLTSLQVSFANFSGQIPHEILHLRNLSLLDMSNNQLTLTSPSLRDVAQTLVKLEYLYLDSVNILSSIPDSVSRLPSLKSLSLSRCGLKGHIPSSIANLVSLETLELGENHLVGQIPCLQNLTKLRELSLRENNLVGDITSSIWNLSELHTLDLPSNGFTGFASTGNITGFPKFLEGKNSLEYIDLSSNNISGEIPKWFLDISANTLSYLNLSHNHLTGFEGNLQLLKWKQLATLDLRFNQFKGLLPTLSEYTSLRDYFVSSNNFYGEIPTSVCDLVALTVLDLGSNNLSGEIPSCFTDLVSGSHLSVLILQSNNFSGRIPQLGKDRCNLVMIDMSYNQLEGPLPGDMKNCRNLEFLNLANNMIHDVFPFWLGRLPALRILILDSNRFHGIIEKPKGDYHFPKLQIISLSKNKFVGSPPLSWTAMKGDADKEGLLKYFGLKDWINTAYYFGNFYYSFRIDNKGMQMEYKKIIESFVVIDLSSNKFMGEISESIGTLKGLHSLNLSNNMLSGPIPFNLNNLTNLESLDLSHNKLSGEIPQSLTDLASLSFFDVSFNQLIGPIPISKQFNTFENDSYRGNSGLCGPPLSKKCGNTIGAPPPPSLVKDHTSKTWIEFDWKVISMGYASGFVIGVTIGTNRKNGRQRVRRAREIRFLLN